jgi:hypothetical protein
MENKKEYKKRLTKESIDIESEFIGKPTGPRKPKEKTDDLSDEIKKFIFSPKNLATLKLILMRLSGPISDYHVRDAKIFVYGLKSSLDRVPRDFIVFISSKKRDYKFFIGSRSFISLSYFSYDIIDKSLLKQSLRHEITAWLHNNPENFITIPG